MLVYWYLDENFPKFILPQILHKIWKLENASLFTSCQIVVMWNTCKLCAIYHGSLVRLTLLLCFRHMLQTLLSDHIDIEDIADLYYYIFCWYYIHVFPLIVGNSIITCESLILCYQVLSSLQKRMYLFELLLQRAICTFRTRTNSLCLHCQNVPEGSA